MRSFLLRNRRTFGKMFEIIAHKAYLSHWWGVFSERQVTCRISFFTCWSLVFCFFSVWFLIWQTIKTVPLVMTFKNNTHPKIQKWYHFASPKSDQIWSHSTCWNFSFKKLVSFEKKWKVSKFFLSLAAQNKSSLDIAFFLGKNKNKYVNDFEQGEKYVMEREKLQERWSNLRHFFCYICSSVIQILSRWVAKHGQALN